MTDNSDIKNRVDTLDETALSAYLTQHIDGFKGPVKVEKFAGGQSNPTFLLKAESGKYVLRRKPPGKLLKSAHAVDREFKVLKALADTGVPVAHGYHLCEDDDVIGSMFYIMSFEPGTVYWDPTLPEIEKENRAAYHHEMIRVMAALHSVDVNLVGLTDYGKPGNYFERQISRWSSQYHAAETQNIQSMNTLLEWLPANLPFDDGQISLIHGDYRLDNAMFSSNEPRMIALLDWELSTLGHPLADLSYFCMGQRLPAAGGLKGLDGIDRASIGVPSEEELVNQYCELRGIEKIEDWHFYLAFSFFRLAAICQGVYKRSLGGNASNKKAASMGAVVEPLAQMGHALVS